jgi:uncharacterized protein (TIGR00288 family)
MAANLGSDAGIPLAIFCDYENVAIGARDAGYDQFDIHLVIERLLDKGPIVVKKAYCDWEKYKSAKKPLHEAAFELIEIPHVSYSGKNSADIRLVVDALDLCYTKPHVEGFVIISGDSDFSPLVSKLRENAKKVVGVGVKSSTSNLLVENCDDFVYYDDLVRDLRRKAQRGTKRQQASAPKAKDAASLEGRRTEGLELVVDTVEALFRDREGNLWSSLVKQTLKRKRPNFAESYHGYRSFNELLEDAQHRGLLVIEKDERSGGYLIKELGPAA